MPRRARLEVPGIPLHITQRGVNRGAVFVDNEDRRLYLNLLYKMTVAHEVAVHAYVLMGNHVHLLTTTSEAGAISMMMRRLGQCYAQAFNRKYCRTGRLWEGRFKSCLVESDRYLLTVYRYIELNPVRAALAETPERYRWSRRCLDARQDCACEGVQPETGALNFLRPLFAEFINNGAILQ